MSLFRRRWFRALLFLFPGCVLVGVVGVSTIDRWLFSMLDPGVFDASKTPPAPNYRTKKAWAALPSQPNGTQAALAKFPAVKEGRNIADVFYVHPTTWVGSQWNGPTDSPEVIKATYRGATLIQGSVFNACCSVYAPYYRQANGRAFIQPDKHGNKAIAVAYSDVRRAFRYFIRHYNKNRPFVLASHSQGTVLAARLLKEEILGTPLEKRWVVAYLIGGPISAKEWKGKAAICHHSTQTRCVLGWNARGPRFRSNGLEFGAVRGKKSALRERLCVNPLTWKQNNLPASRKQHLGAVFFDSPNPTLLPQFASARCSEGRLLVTRMGTPYRDGMSKILDWMMGPDNYHPFEYQLFYINLRLNAVERVMSWLRRKKKKKVVDKPLSAQEKKRRKEQILREVNKKKGLLKQLQKRD